jgi:cytochrome c-type biogenesis protein CcmH/NrfF
MRRFKSSLLALLVAALALAQTAVEKPSVDALRVAHRIACQCGCKDTVATCAMLECSFSKPAKEKIAKLQAAGTPDQAIVNQFIAEYGQGIFRAEPNAFGWVVPYAVLLPGFALIWWFVRRYHKPRPVQVTGPALDDPELAKYNEQIEKDLAHLD